MLGMTENKRYDVIYEKEPRGQVVTDNGIPCTARTCCTRLNRLEEENTRLKERNNRQCKQLDDLCRLIEEKDWRALTDILDDFKRNDEQLQKEWREYND